MHYMTDQWQAMIDGYKMNEVVPCKNCCESLLLHMYLVVCSTGE